MKRPASMKCATSVFACFVFLTCRNHVLDFLCRFVAGCNCADRNQRDEHCKRSDQPSAEDYRGLLLPKTSRILVQAGQYIDVTLLYEGGPKQQPHILTGLFPTR